MTKLNIKLRVDGITNVDKDSGSQPVESEVLDDDRLQVVGAHVATDAVLGALQRTNPNRTQIRVFLLGRDQHSQQTGCQL